VHLGGFKQGPAFLLHALGARAKPVSIATVHAGEDIVNNCTEWTGFGNCVSST
jgi:hypothetical protein